MRHSGLLGVSTDVEALVDAEEHLLEELESVELAGLCLGEDELHVLHVLGVVPVQLLERRLVGGLAAILLLPALLHLLHQLLLLVDGQRGVALGVLLVVLRTSLRLAGRVVVLPTLLHLGVELRPGLLHLPELLVQFFGFLQPRQRLVVVLTLRPRLYRRRYLKANQLTGPSTLEAIFIPPR